MTPRDNALLAALPPSQYKKLLPKLKRVSLTRGQVLFDVGDVPDYVYFPVGAVVSMVNDIDESAELHMLGKTCMVGVGTRNAPSHYQAEVIVPGLAFRLRAADLPGEPAHNPQRSGKAPARTGVLMRHITRRISCIKHHSIEKHIIRWALLMLDRLGDQTIQTSQAALAGLIGCSREMLSGVLKGLSEQGYIAVSRGQIEVLDRAALELISCNHYWHAHHEIR